jgi:hypothetical protein
MLIVTQDVNGEVVNLDRMATIGVSYTSQCGWSIRCIENTNATSAIEIARYDMQDKAQRTLRDILDAYNDNQRVFYVDV